jgi:hypothetical protein
MKQLFEDLRAGLGEVQKTLETEMNKIGINPSEVQSKVEMIAQFTGMQSIEPKNLEKHPLYELFLAYNHSNEVRGTTVSISNFFGVVEQCKITIEDPKYIH